MYKRGTTFFKNTDSAATKSIACAREPHFTVQEGFGRSKTLRGLSALAKVGAPAGRAIRGEELADVVIIEARDGYKVALDLAGTDPTMRNERVILADRMDGAPLDSPWAVSPRCGGRFAPGARRPHGFLHPPRTYAVRRAWLAFHAPLTPSRLRKKAITRASAFRVGPSGSSSRRCNVKTE